MSNNLNSIWDIVWTNDSYSISGLRQEKARQKVDSFSNHLNLNVNSICIDLGCGGGYVSKEIFMRYKCKVIGVDFSDYAIKTAVSNCANSDCSFIKSSITKMNLPNNYADVILCIGVLEHVDDICLALSEINRILKPGGICIIISSNCYSFMYIDRLIKQFLHLWKYGYQKNWSQKEFCKTITSFGFDIISKKVLQGFGDFHIKNALDTIVHKFVSQWGRYFQVVGRKQ